MGSFDGTCQLSRLHIGYGDKALLIPIVSIRDGKWTIRSPPLKCVYDDYGRFDFLRGDNDHKEEIKRIMFLNLFKKDFVEHDKTVVAGKYDFTDAPLDKDSSFHDIMNFMFNKRNQQLYVKHLEQNEINLELEQNVSKLSYITIREDVFNNLKKQKHNDFYEHPNFNISKHLDEKWNIFANGFDFQILTEKRLLQQKLDFNNQHIIYPLTAADAFVNAPSDLPPFKQDIVKIYLDLQCLVSWFFNLRTTIEPQNQYWSQCGYFEMYQQAFTSILSVVKKEIKTKEEF